MQKTDLNVSPYYDDFDPTDNFHRVLFRPDFAVRQRTYDFTINSSKSN